MPTGENALELKTASLGSWLECGKDGKKEEKDTTDRPRDVKGFHLFDVSVVQNSTFKLQ